MIETDAREAKVKVTGAGSIGGLCVGSSSAVEL